MNEDDAVRAALSQYYDSSRPAGYAASFRAGWDAGRRYEAERKAVLVGQPPGRYCPKCGGKLDPDGTCPVAWEEAK